MSTDHTPGMEGEEERVVRAGMEIIDASYEENGVTVKQFKVSKGPKEKLGMSRAFGDFAYKESKIDDQVLPLWEQAVVSRPTIVERERAADDLFLVLACDGIWDVMSNGECAAFVAAMYEEISGGEEGRGMSGGEICAKVCDGVCRECLKRGSADNMTAMVVKLDGRGGGVEGAEMAMKKLDMNTK